MITFRDGHDQDTQQDYRPPHPRHVARRPLKGKVRLVHGQTLVDRDGKQESRNRRARDRETRRRVLQGTGERSLSRAPSGVAYPLYVPPTTRRARRVNMLSPAHKRPPRQARDLHDGKTAAPPTALGSTTLDNYYCLPRCHRWQPRQQGANQSPTKRRGASCRPSCCTRRAPGPGRQASTLVRWKARCSRRHRRRRPHPGDAADRTRGGNGTSRPPPEPCC